MSEDFKYRVFSDYIRVESGIVRNASDEAARQKLFWSKVADLCRETGISRVLAISRMSGTLDTYISFDIAGSPGNFGWSRSIKLAIFYMDEERFKSGKFSETVAVNRGYSFRAFKTEEEALDWLLK